MPGGSPICLGQIGAAHGTSGEVRLRSFTADPQAIAGYGPLETEDGRVFTIESLRPAKDHFVARLSGIADRNAAEQLTNKGSTSRANGCRHQTMRMSFITPISSVFPSSIRRARLSAPWSPFTTSAPVI